MRQGDPAGRACSIARNSGDVSGAAEMIAGSRFPDGLPQTEKELLERLSDPNWRLRNIYWIKDKDAREILFKPWEEQEKLLANLWFRNVVLKARQRGFSTMIQIAMLDTCLFNKNIEAAVIAQDRDAATGIFRKLEFAYERLPEVVRRMNPLTTDAADELILSNGSSLQVATSVRSGTKQWLHVSEYGKICAKYPDKAEEISTGSLPAVDQNGIVVIESTAEGRDGDFYDKAERSRAIAELGRPLSKAEYKFHFASWWDADEYELDPEGVIITPKDHAYFYRLEGEIGRVIGPRKRAWYVSKRDNDFSGAQDKMFREYPSTPKEAFEQSTEGVYLADQLSLARRQGRIGVVPHRPGLVVNTFWDLMHGGNDDVAIWFHQQVGLRDHWIKFIEGSGEPYGFYVRQMQELAAEGYVWGRHYLPHDADRRFPGAEANPTIRDMLEGLGLRNCETVQRIADLTAGIQMLRNDFASYWIDETNCAPGLKHLERYSKDWNTRLGAWRDTPREDGHQHAADAMRQKAQGYRAVSGLTGAPGQSRRRRNRNRSQMAA
jgi:hypothetical protein